MKTVPTSIPQSPSAQFQDRVTTIRLPNSPHILFFSLYNAIYFLPLFIIGLSGYVDDGAAEAIGTLDNQVIVSMTIVYGEGLLAFLLGAVVTKWIPGFHATRDSVLAIPKVHMGLSEQLSVAIIAAVFLCAKAALVPLGVYHAYAAETGEMTGGMWSFSMVCSEFLLFASIIVLNSDSRRNVSAFMLLSFLNCINLLHGTRIIFTVNMLVFILYCYMTGKLTLKRILVFGPLLSSAVVALAYYVFLARSGVAMPDDFSLARLVSPLVYESLFSQLSLASVISTPEILNSTGSPKDFGVDVILFTAPRFLVPGKDALTYIQQFNYMSPLGAFNGYAEGLIYFGALWPIFYFTLGFFASWIYAKAKRTPYLWLCYSYFTADVLFRFMRDGYLIPIKIFCDILALLLFLVVFKTLVRGLARKRTQSTEGNDTLTVQLDKYAQ